MITASPQLLAQKGGTARHYQRARLVDAADRPIKAADLEVGESYLFHYPYISTPCFLLNLGRPATGQTTLSTEDGRSYRWEGGVGRARSVVAYSAICAHKMTHPARAVSFINYRHDPVYFLDQDSHRTRRDDVIYCCSEKSVYDPLQGARVLGGPARQPLAAILLEYDGKDDSLTAVGTYGGEMFDRFFSQFGFRLQLEHQVEDVRRKVGGTATVVKLADYCASQVLCG
jgi:Rieske Fe-S protein